MMKKISIALLALMGFSFYNLTTSLVQKTSDDLPKVYTEKTSGSNKFDSIIRLHDKYGNFFCSGIVVDGSYALTAAHCLTNDLGKIDKDDIHIYDVNGFYTNTIVKAAAIEKLRDVGFIRGNFSEFKTAPVDFLGEDIKTGMLMQSCGYPSGEKLFCISLVLIGNHYFQYRTLGSPIFKGMSGGAVYSYTTGRVVGVNSAVDETSVIVGPLVGILSLVGL